MRDKPALSRSFVRAMVCGLSLLLVICLQSWAAGTKEKFDPQGRLNVGALVLALPVLDESDSPKKPPSPINSHALATDGPEAGQSAGQSEDQPVGLPNLPSISPLRPAGNFTPPVTPTANMPPAAITDNDVVLNFEDADLLDVIHTIFGEILKVNYAVDPQVKGKVTIRISKPISRKDVLPVMQMILKLNGAGFTEEDGIYKILPVNEIPETTPRVYVYPLQNSKAAHVAQLLQSIFSGSSMSSSGSHGPMISQPQMPGGPAGAAGTKSLVSSSTRVLADEITNSLIVLSTPEDYKFIKKTIQKLDTIPRQVMIDVLIAEITLSDEFKFGLEWVLANNLHLTNKINLNGQAGQNTNQLNPLPNPLPTTSGAITTLGGFSYAALDAAGQVKALLQALASKNKLNIIASPHILCADNLEARIQIGDEIPIATSQATTVGGGAVASSGLIATQTIQYKDTGTILKVKPQINESGLVSLQVNQEVSNATPETILGSQQFVISKREVTTNLVAQDGQTIVLGGLINESTTKTRTGIPILMDIPILGYLFGATDNSTTRTEIIVLLTPHVIRNQKEAGHVTKDYINRLKGLNKDFKTTIPFPDGKK